MTRFERAYFAALELVTVLDLARKSGRGLSTIQAYKTGTRRVTADAGEELVSYLRERAAAFTKAADKLEAATKQERGKHA